jgi:nucleotide-binding universal stress UspA family protein
VTPSQKESVVAAVDPRSTDHILSALEEHPADPTVERVLLATDGGPASEAVVRWLVHRTKLHRLNVEIMSVLDTDALWRGYYMDDPTGGAEAAVRHAERQVLRASPGAHVRTRILEGDARSAIESASDGADLLVVGSNRTSVHSGLRGGTFSVKVAEGARCPVVVVPRSWEPSNGPVVVGVQADSTDEPALDFALREARVVHRPIRLVHAWRTPDIIPLGPDTEEASRLHETALRDVVTRLREENRDVSLEAVLVEGNSASALLDEGGRACLLVIGSHGRTTFERFFLGSVSREVLLQPACPVALIRRRS